MGNGKIRSFYGNKESELLGSFKDLFSWFIANKDKILLPAM